MVWEKGVVGIANESGDGEEKVTILGKNVIVETGAVVEAGARVGEGSVVEGFVRVGEGCVVGKVCFHVHCWRDFEEMVGVYANEFDWFVVLQDHDTDISPSQLGPRRLYDTLWPKSTQER